MHRLKGGFWRQSRRIKFVFDVAAWAVAIAAAYTLRLEAGPGVWLRDAALMTLVAIPTVLFANQTFALHRQSWGHVGVRDLARLSGAALLTGSVLGVLVLIIGAWIPTIFVPRSIPILATLVAFLIMGGARILVRSLNTEGLLSRNHGPRTLIVGSEGAGLVLARELDASGTARVVGFLDENPLHKGLSYLGHPVLGAIKDLPQVVQERRVEQLFIALDSTHASRKEALAAAQKTGVRFRSTPSVEQLLAGRLQPDSQGLLPTLLQRDAIALDDAAVRAMLTDRVVLVTGAGGSIGSEIVRQSARYDPRKLILVAHEENSLFELEQGLVEDGITAPREHVIASVRDAARLEEVFTTHKPQVVFHAAAHKHVPLMESNPGEAVANNVFGTKNLADLVVRHGVERFVNISTDKAVRPTNVMGASKRVAEMVTTDAARQAQSGQHLVSVRFGNVLGSRGSVIPTWMRQIAQGGPVTITDERMTRYFMLIPEAVQLVLQAAALGGKGLVYVLDMGQPVRLVDVANQLIRMHGLVPGDDVRIAVTGMRPGEKLYEELLVDASHQEPSAHPKIFIEKDVEQPDSLSHLLAQLQQLVVRRDPAAIRDALLSAAAGAPVPSSPPRQKLEPTPP